MLLRAGLVLALEDAGQPLTIPELVRALAARGLRPPPGRPGKAISAAMDVEVRRDRVRRVARGTYALARPLDRRERHRARKRVHAARLGQAPPSLLA